MWPIWVYNTCEYTYVSIHAISDLVKQRKQSAEQENSVIVRSPIHSMQINTGVVNENGESQTNVTDAYIYDEGIYKRRHKMKEDDIPHREIWNPASLIFHFYLFCGKSHFHNNGAQRVVKQLVYLFGAPFLKKEQGKGHKIKGFFTESCICNTRLCHILMVLMSHRKIYNVMHKNRLFGQGSRSKSGDTHICTMLSRLSQGISTSLLIFTSQWQGVKGGQG